MAAALTIPNHLYLFTNNMPEIMSHASEHIDTPASYLLVIANLLADEHGYRQVRNGHAPECCTYCQAIQKARNIAAANGQGNYDNEPFYDAVSDYDLNLIAIEENLLTEDEEHLNRDKVVALLKTHYDAISLT